MRLVKLLLLAAIPLTCAAQGAWVPLWGSSAEPGQRQRFAMVRQCEAGYWVQYTLERNRTAVTASGQPCNAKTQSCYPPGSIDVTVRRPQSQACAPVGARCQWHERALPNGAWERRVLCNPEVAAVGRQPAQAAPGTNADAGRASLGTGFAVSPRHVVTNHHVVASCVRGGSVRVHDRSARVIASDAGNDLALLLLDSDSLLSARLRADESRGVRVGEAIAVVGYPLPGILTSDLVATTGIVSALAGPRNNAGLIQISAPVQPGNSGGPVLDEYGYVVGVVVGKLDALRIAGRTGDVPQNVNFSIALAVLKNFLRANRVGFGAGPASNPIPISQAVDEARGYTYQVACTAL